MRRFLAVPALALALAAAGCGTTRMTDTQRALSEMSLVSQAIDRAVAQVDFAALEGKTVFLDTQYLDGTVDKGYLISGLRQQLLAQGALLQEERTKATFVVEPRSGGIGTDKHSLLVGTPAMSLPAVVPGVPSAIPEIALIKKTDQRGGAKIAVFAYNRVTGRALWQSDVVESASNLKDTWFFGAGPYRRGSIQRESEFAGESLPRLPAGLHVFPEESNAAKADPDKLREVPHGKPNEAAATPAPGHGPSLFGFERPLFPAPRPTGVTAPTGTSGPEAVISPPSVERSVVPPLLPVPKP